MKIVTRAEFVTFVVAALKNSCGGIRILKAKPVSAWSVVDQPEDAHVEWRNSKGEIEETDVGVPPGTQGGDDCYAVEWYPWDGIQDCPVLKRREFVVPVQIPEDVRAELHKYLNDLL